MPERTLGLIGGMSWESTSEYYRIVNQTVPETPWLHIADPTAAALRDVGARTVGLLGTRFTMEEAFYRGRLEQRHGLEVRVPDAQIAMLLRNANDAPVPLFDTGRLHAEAAAAWWLEGR